MNSSRRRLIFATLLVAALGLRLVAIGSRPLWYDEAFSALFAEKGPTAMLAGTLAQDAGAAAEEHPLLYYGLLWGWMQPFGSSAAAVRAFSLLPGMGIVVLAYLIGRDLLDKSYGLWAAAVVAFSPFQIHYAQEARMYALMAFLLMGSVWAFWQGHQTNQWGWWLLFGVCAALGQYTHNLAAFFLLPLAAIPLLKRDWRALRAVLIAGLGALLLYFPWLLRLPSQFAKVQHSYWVERPLPTRLVTTLLAFVTNLPVPDDWLPVALFITMLVFALGIWQTGRACRRGDTRVRRGLWLLYLALTPVLFLYLFSLWQPVFIERALLPSGVLFLMWLIWALERTQLPLLVRNLALTILGVGFVLGVYQRLSYTGFPYGPYASLDAYLAEQAAPGEVILHSNKLTALPMIYYDRTLSQRFMADPPGSGSDTLAPATQAVLGLSADADLGSATADAPRVWLIIFNRAIEEYQAIGESTHPHIAWLESYYAPERVEQWGDVRVYVFVRE